jgi:DNA ligase (NAD+)
MDEIFAPTLCPECSDPVHLFNEEKSQVLTHWCVNDKCPGRIREMMTFIADRTLLEIDGLGPETATILVKKGYVTDLPDLFEYANDVAAARERVGEARFEATMRKNGLSAASMIKMLDAIDRAKTAGWDRWIAALGIPSIGLQLGKVLARELKLGAEDMQLLGSILHKPSEPNARDIEGIGFHKKAELAAFAQAAEASGLGIRLHLAGVRPTPVDQPVVVEGSPLAGMAFCITGEFYALGSREFISSRLTSLGAVSKSGVTKKVTHLLVGAEAGRVKIAKAVELKIPQYGEEWLEETFNKYGIKTSGASLEAEWAEG